MTSRPTATSDLDERLLRDAQNRDVDGRAGKALTDPSARKMQSAPLEVIPTNTQGRGWQPRTSTIGTQLWIRLSFLLVVVAPVVLVAVYALFVATPRYVSEFRATVRTVEQTRSMGLTEIFGLGVPSQTTNDANAVVQYIHSRNAVESIDKRFPLRAALTADGVDFVTRFYGKPDIEAITRYWNRMVDAFYEPSTATITVRASAFTPSEALKVAQYLLEDSEALVNRMSLRTRADVLAQAQAEVAKAEKQMRVLSARYEELQNKEAILDPKGAAGANLALASRLREQISQKNAELAASKRLSPSTPGARAMEQYIAALERELADVEARATGTAGGARDGAKRPISSVLGEFSQLAEERKFAEKAYLSALSSLETARIEAARQQVYLSVIIPPGIPEEADFPRPWRMIGLTALVAGAVWLIALMGVYSIREHV